MKLWLASGELDRAMRWAEERSQTLWYGNPFTREREEIANARVFLAKRLPHLVLQCLEPVLERVTVGQRWGHIIEVRILQALAYQMCHEEMLALSTLSEAVRLAEPEGYIRSFVDEGAPMETLLYRLRKRNRKSRPTLYLDTLLTAFQQESTACVEAQGPTQAQALSEPLSEREMQVLLLLAHGAPNLVIAQDLVIAVDTVKRHVSHIFAKLGVCNRVQAVKQARELSLLDKEERIPVQALPESLSLREKQVLQLLAYGASNQEIAKKLKIGVDTIKRHVSHIFSKLGVENRVQIAKQARALGLLDEER